MAEREGTEPPPRSGAVTLDVEGSNDEISATAQRYSTPNEMAVWAVICEPVSCPIPC